MTSGTNDLGGVFQLTFTGNGVTLTTRELQYDESAFGVKSALEELDNIGEVEVEKSTDPNLGFNWLITFSGCSRKENSDVCNVGDLLVLEYVNSLTGCDTPKLEVTQIVAGNGPSNEYL